MSEAQQLVSALLDGIASDFIKGTTTPDIELRKLGFKEHINPVEGTRNVTFWKSFPRPRGIHWPFGAPARDIVLEVHRYAEGKAERVIYEIGVSTLGQTGMDYPDIWLGRFPAPAVARITRALIDILNDLPEELTHDHLDRMLRLVVKL